MRSPRNDQAIGLKNNKYQFDSHYDYMKYQVQSVENSIIGKKQNWLSNNMQEWNKSTPGIYNYHKEADKVLHNVKPNHTFVSVRRIPPKLP